MEWHHVFLALVMMLQLGRLVRMAKSSAPCARALLIFMEYMEDLIACLPLRQSFGFSPQGQFPRFAFYNINKLAFADPLGWSFEDLLKFVRDTRTFIYDRDDYSLPSVRASVYDRDGVRSLEALVMEPYFREFLAILTNNDSERREVQDLARRSLILLHQILQEWQLACLTTRPVLSDYLRHEVVSSV